MKRIIRTYSKKILSGILILSLIVPATLLTLPQKAEAQATGVGACLGIFLPSFLQSSGEKLKPVVPVTNAGSIYTDGAQTGATYTQFWQDCLQKPLAIAFARLVIAEITNSLVAWINGGFDGSPKFLTDPGGFLLNIGDGLLSDIILSSDLAFLCSPFKAQVQIALAINYSYGNDLGRQAQCTLEDVVGNIEGFFKDFSQGGWNGWFSMTQNPYNNPYGAYLESKAALHARIGQSQSIELAKLDWGSGFFSQEECDEYGNCDIVTPGHTIGAALDAQFFGAANQIGLADSFDKIFNALADQLFSTLLTSAGGLLGSSGISGDQNSNNFRDRIDRAGDISDYLDDIDGATSGDNGGLPGGVTPAQNVAQGKPVDSSGSRTGNPARKIVDSDRDNGFDELYTGYSSTPSTGTTDATSPWVEIDLERTYDIGRIRIFQRTNPDEGRINNLVLRAQIFDENRNLVWESTTYPHDLDDEITIYVPGTIGQGVKAGRYVRIQSTATTNAPGRLALAEVEVETYILPAITLRGPSTVFLPRGNSYIDAGADAVDGQGRPLTVPLPTGTVNIDTPGTYTLTYTVADQNGAIGTATRDVTVN
ncbi:DUF5011 domain-containing protein [Candidatus Parcubacteria bacterium]|nr:DUF5011 domain-containing protein [Candidatus Parcubacteria bacterium]